MADDEGADYWAAVYGQPVHVYANEREQAHPSGPQGELERMTDEDYAAYVRQRMWEKTHAGMLEERARQDEARKQRKESERQRRRAQRDVDESLRRGEERRRRRRWTDLWELYQSAWADWGGQPDKLPWPLESGQADDVSPESVRTFVIHGLRLDDNDGDASQQDRDAKVARLKEERVRWHPDKVQQKAGGKVDEPTMRNVTAIFQIIDRLWGERRPKD